MYVLQCGMIITETIFTKLTLAGNRFVQNYCTNRFVQNYCTKFHEFLINSSVAHTTSNRGGLTDRRDLHTTQGAPFSISPRTPDPP
jgi:hypothetical protein